MKSFLHSAMMSFFQFIGGLISRLVGWMVNTVLPAFGAGLMTIFTKLIGVMVGEKGLDPALFTDGMILILAGIAIGGDTGYMMAAIGFLLWIGFVVRRFDKLGG